MITQNGLNLFKMLLTNSCPKPSVFTDIDGNTDYVTSLEGTGTSWSYRYSYYSGTAGTTVSGTFYANSSTFMPHWNYISKSFNQGINTNSYKTTKSFGRYVNYLSKETSVITIPTNVELGKTTLLGSFYKNAVSFAVPNMLATGTTATTLLNWHSIGIYGTAPNDLEYLTITIPKHFNTSNSLALGPTLGTYTMNIFTNLGYSNKVESIDDYDLVSPVFNKQLSPLTMGATFLDGKIEFTIAFKNYTSESISVNEFGLYCGSGESDYSNPVGVNNKVSFSGYKVGRNTDQYFTLFDEMYINSGWRPNLIVRKVLPQTITIPPDGVATFKYTIDLSEMKAQENIAYEQA